VKRRLLGPGWVTPGIAGALAAGVLGAGFALQKTLPTPPSTSRTALRAATWFERYRLVESTFTLADGPTVHGTCLQDWFILGGHRRRGAALRLDSGFVLLAVPPHTLEARGGTVVQSATDPLVLLELGGCPRVLARRLSTLAAEHRGLTQTGHTLAFDLKGTRVTLTLDPRSGRPLALRVVTSAATGVSHIRFTAVTTRLRRELARGLPVYES
jgi:hypothetical protein